MQETVNALDSMMSVNDVIAFSLLCANDKMESLSSIREIVCGMRVFNKDAGHCGNGIIDSKFVMVKLPIYNHQSIPIDIKTFK